MRVLQVRIKAWKQTQEKTQNELRKYTDIALLCSPFRGQMILTFEFAIWIVTNRHQCQIACLYLLSQQGSIIPRCTNRDKRLLRAPRTTALFEPALCSQPCRKHVKLLVQCVQLFYVNTLHCVNLWSISTIFCLQQKIVSSRNIWQKDLWIILCLYCCNYPFSSTRSIRSLWAIL